MKKAVACFVVLAAIVAVTACKKSGDQATPTLPTEKIAGDIGSAVCEKMKACGQVCPENLSQNIATSLPESAKTITEDTLKSCVNSIASADCAQLQSDTAPTGCEFMNN